jgi:hypothetical protein
MMPGRESKRRRKMEDEKQEEGGLTLVDISKMGNAYGHPYGVQLMGNRFASVTFYILVKTHNRSNEQHEQNRVIQQNRVV